MRLFSSLLAFVLLVFSAHWAIFALNPGIADARPVAPAHLAAR